jgi:signal transduction histidine kinase
VVQKITKAQENALQMRNLNLHLDEANWPEKMRADNDLLALALGNLLSNAIKYTPDGGDIYISARIDDQNAVITVRDTGIGVAQDEQERIFDRFHTAGDTMLHSTSKSAFRGGGLGLGLAIAKAIVDAHGGKIWVESSGLDVDKLPGSSFIFRLPLNGPVQQRRAAG